MSQGLSNALLPAVTACENKSSFPSKYFHLFCHDKGSGGEKWEGLEAEVASGEKQWANRESPEC